MRKARPAVIGIAGIALILGLFLGYAPAEDAPSAHDAASSRATALAARWLAAEPEELAEVYEELETYSPAEKNDVDRTIRRLAAFERGGLAEEGQYKAWLALEEVFLLVEDMAMRRHGKALRDMPREELKTLLAEAASVYPGGLDPSIFSRPDACGSDDADKGPLPAEARAAPTDEP